MLGESSPFMAEQFRLVSYYNLARYMENTWKIYGTYMEHISGWWWLEAPLGLSSPALSPISTLERKSCLIRSTSLSGYVLVGGYYSCFDLPCFAAVVTYQSLPQYQRTSSKPWLSMVQYCIYSCLIPNMLGLHSHSVVNSHSLLTCA